MKELIKKAIQAREMSEIDSFDDGYGQTKVYGMEAEGHTLRVWNSSNHEDFDHKEALNYIAAQLLDGKTEGQFADSWWHEIMYEVV